MSSLPLVPRTVPGFQLALNKFLMNRGRKEGKEGGREGGKEEGRKERKGKAIMSSIRSEPSST